MKRSSLSRDPHRPKPKAHPADLPKALGTSATRKGPWRSTTYIAYVKANFRCLTCQGPAQHAHHIRECLPRTMGVRISDKYIVALCARCHTDLHARSSTFWTDRHIQPAALLTWCECVHANWVRSV